MSKLISSWIEETIQNSICIESVVRYEKEAKSESMKQKNKPKKQGKIVQILESNLSEKPSYLIISDKCSFITAFLSEEAIETISLYCRHHLKNYVVVIQDWSISTIYHETGSSILENEHGRLCLRVRSLKITSSDYGTFGSPVNVNSRIRDPLKELNDFDLKQRLQENSSSCFFHDSKISDNFSLLRFMKNLNEKDNFSSSSSSSSPFSQNSTIQDLGITKYHSSSSSVSSQEINQENIVPIFNKQSQEQEPSCAQEIINKSHNSSPLSQEIVIENNISSINSPKQQQPNSSQESNTVSEDEDINDSKSSSPLFRETIEEENYMLASDTQPLEQVHNLHHSASVSREEVPIHDKSTNFQKPSVSQDSSSNNNSFSLSSSSQSMELLPAHPTNHLLATTEEKKDKKNVQSTQKIDKAPELLHAQYFISQSLKNCIEEISRIQDNVPTRDEQACNDDQILRSTVEHSQPQDITNRLHYQAIDTNIVGYSQSIKKNTFEHTQTHNFTNHIQSQTIDKQTLQHSQTQDLSNKKLSQEVDKNTLQHSQTHYLKNEGYPQIINKMCLEYSQSIDKNIDENYHTQGNDEAHYEELNLKKASAQYFEDDNNRRRKRRNVKESVSYYRFRWRKNTLDIFDSTDEDDEEPQQKKRLILSRSETIPVDNRSKGRRNNGSEYQDKITQNDNQTRISKEILNENRWKEQKRKTEIKKSEKAKEKHLTISQVPKARKRIGQRKNDADYLYGEPDTQEDYDHSTKLIEQQSTCGKELSKGIIYTEGRRNDSDCHYYISERETEISSKTNKPKVHTLYAKPPKVFDWDNSEEDEEVIKFNRRKFFRYSNK